MRLKSLFLRLKKYEIKKAQVISEGFLLKERESLGGEKKDLERKDKSSPIPESEALRIVFEDEQTSHFIRVNFSSPEQKPHILSRRNLSRRDHHFLWVVEIIERIPLVLEGEDGLMNIARIEVDLLSGEIIDRQFYAYILEEEYQERLEERPK